MALNPHTLRSPQPQPAGLTARVVRADSTGIWVVPLGGDQRHPVGPCMGSRDATGTPAVQEGDLCLLVATPDGPWALPTRSTPGGGGSAPTGPAGGVLTGSYPDPGLAPGVVTSTHIADATIVHGDVAPANRDGAAATPSLRTLGTGAQQAAAGNDPRLSDARTPTAHAHAAGDVTSGTLGIARIPTGTTASTVTIGNDPRLSDARTPTGAAGGVLSGTYPNPGLATGAVTSGHIADGTIVHGDVAAANRDGAAATPSMRTLGTGAQQAAAGNDARLSDARTPTAHVHSAADVTSGTLGIDRIPTGTTASTVALGNDARLSDPRTPTGAAGGDLAGTYPNPTIGTGKVTSAHIADATIVHGDVAPANVDGTATTPSLRTLGTGAQQAVSGTDARLSNARTPTGAAGGDLAGTFPNPTIGTGKVTSAHIADATIVHGDVAAANKDGAAATPSLRTLGTGAQQAAAGNDPRLSDARTPVAHGHTLSDVTAGGALVPPLVLVERAVVPATPAAGQTAVYARTDGRLYLMDDTGVERPLVPRPDQLHLNPSLDSVAPSTVGPGSSTVPSRQMPNSWDWFWATGTTALTSDNTVTLDGLGYSLRVSVTDGFQRVFSSTVPVAPGALVTFSAWVRGTAGAAVAVGMFSRASGTPGPLDPATTIQSSGELNPDTTWRKVSASWMVPEGHTVARFELWCSSPAGTPRDVWWDATESSMQLASPAQVVTGTMHLWPAATAPAGYLLCNGATFSSDSYPALATLLGDTYGTHSGTTYYLPDMRGRVPVGVGTATGAAGAIAHPLTGAGSRGGEETHVLTTGEMPSHTHVQDQHSHQQQMVTGNYAAGGGSALAGMSSGAASTGAAYQYTQFATATNQNTGGGGAHNNMPPYQAINYIIKT